MYLVKCVRAEIFKKLIETYRNQVLSKTKIFRWYKLFLNGQETVEDELSFAYNQIEDSYQIRLMGIYKSINFNF